MSESIKRGDIYIVDFDPPKGEEFKVGSEILKRRPAVVMSHNAINRVGAMSPHDFKLVENGVKEALGFAVN